MSKITDIRSSKSTVNRMDVSQKLAKQIRIHALNMTHSGRCSHIGSCLSIADILAVLYTDILRISPSEPSDPERDRFVLSKGHAGAALYAALAESGFFSIEKLHTHYGDASELCGHATSHGNPGVEASTGALGHGLPIATGMALNAKLSNRSYRTFCLMSDGECDEGSVWEAALFAAHHFLGSLVAIIDYNKIQSLDTVANTLALEPLTKKWEAFGWNVIEVEGHSHSELLAAFSSDQCFQDKPTMLIAHTIKGKGVSFMENTVLWHYRTAQGEEYQQALRELEQG